MADPGVIVFDEGLKITAPLDPSVKKQMTEQTIAAAVIVLIGLVLISAISKG